MLESVIEKRLVDKIKKIGGWCIKLPATFISGIPDRMCLLPGGIMFFVETKAPGKDLRPLQKVIRRKLIKLGFKHYKIDTKFEVDKLITEYEILG